MLDKIGFFAFIVSLFIGGDAVISETFGTLKNYAELTAMQIERKLVPFLAKIAQRALIAAAILLAAVPFVVMSISERSASDMIAAHKPFIVFVVMSIGILAMLAAWQEAAKPVFRRSRYPQEENGTPHPFAGERRIVANAFRPNRLSLGATVAAIFAALIGTGIGVIGIDHAEKSAVTGTALHICGSALILAAIVFLWLVCLGLGWLIAKGGEIGGWTLRLGLSQTLIVLAGITTENIEEKINGVRGPDWTLLRRNISNPFTDVTIMTATYLVGIGVFRHTAFSLILLGIYLGVTILSLANARVNPIQEHIRRQRITGFFTPVFIVLVLGSILWHNTAPPSAHDTLKGQADALWAFALGNACLPAVGDYNDLFVTTGLIVLTLWAMTKYGSALPRWFKIAVYTVAFISVLLFPLRYTAGLLAKHHGEAEICRIGSNRTPRKLADMPGAKPGNNSGSGRSSSSTVYTPPAAETQPESASRASVPLRQPMPPVDEEGLVPGFRDNALGAMRRRGHL